MRAAVKGEGLPCISDAASVNRHVRSELDRNMSSLRSMAQNLGALLIVSLLCLGCSASGTASPGAKSACVKVPMAVGRDALSNGETSSVRVGALVYVELVEPAKYALGSFAWLTAASSDPYVLRRVPLCVDHRAPSTLPVRISAFRALHAGAARLTASLAPRLRAMKPSRRRGMRAYESTVHVGSHASAASQRVARAASMRRAAPGSTGIKPRIVWDPIPFGPQRKAQMKAYAERHYGLHTYRLIDPHVIVIHYTVTPNFQSTYDTFAPDTPDPELHELPNTCAHFVIDRAGIIHQLVSLKIMCRHTVGLNWTAIGIEHVGYSDREVLDNPRQIDASLRLVRWLRCRFHIPVKDVIGHNESLSSPYHHENVPSLRTQTHSDFGHADMQVYRARLRALGGCPAA